MKIYGTLRGDIINYNHNEGLHFEVEKNITIQELLSVMSISSNESITAIVDGIVVQAEYKLQADNTVSIMKSIQGG